MERDDANTLCAGVKASDLGFPDTVSDGLSHYYL